MGCASSEWPALGIQATPTFVIGRDVLPGALDAAAFANLIANASAMPKANTMPAATNEAESPPADRIILGER
jgi:predicted DsbA family dithiol-disulfide isomerase